MNLILYSTQGCHLCDQAALVIENSFSLIQKPYTLNIVDIADSDALFDRYSTLIPVLLRDDIEEVFELHWPFDEQQLFQFLCVSRKL